MKLRRGKESNMVLAGADNTPRQGGAAFRAGCAVESGGLARERLLMSAAPLDSTGLEARIDPPDCVPGGKLGPVKLKTFFTRY